MSTLLPRAPIRTPGYFAASANGSGGQFALRVSSHRLYRFGSGRDGRSKHGSFRRPMYNQRLSRLNGSAAWDDTVLSRSRLDSLDAASRSQKRALPHGRVKYPRLKARAYGSTEVD